MLFLFWQFDLDMWNPFFGDVSSVITCLALGWARAGDTWLELSQVKLVDELFYWIRQGWLLSHGSGTSPMGAIWQQSERRWGRKGASYHSKLSIEQSRLEDQQLDLGLLIWRCSAAEGHWWGGWRGDGKEETTCQAKVSPKKRAPRLGLCV